MKLTYSKHLNPEFRLWLHDNIDTIKAFFTLEIEREYETLEDFAVELYLTIKAGA